MLHLYTNRKETNSLIELFVAQLRKRTLLVATDKLKKVINYGILYKNKQQQWRIADKNNAGSIPQGTYIFVRMTSGFIRVQPADSSIKHLGLASYAEKVLYAGEVAFKDNGSGEMLWWSNQSGGYKPVASLNFLANLPTNLFHTATPSSEDLENTKDNLAPAEPARILV